MPLPGTATLLALVTLTSSGAARELTFGEGITSDECPDCSFESA